jgi:phospholipase/carboxylesterase
VTKLSGPMLAPQSGQAPKQAVVLLHGYGSNGADLIALAPAWQNVLPEAVFLAPDAPAPTRMLSQGFQWFDIDFEGDRLASRQAGVIKARPIVVEFLEDLWAQTGIAPQDTILCGFSQGAMMALHVGLSLQQPLMGVVAFAGALLPPEGFGTLPKPPVCLVHGDRDDVVAPDFSRDADALLRENGYDVSYYSSPGVGHGVSPDGLDFATRFVERVARK